MHIGNLAAASGLTTKTIRFYEQADILPPPPRTRGGYRDYPPETASRLAFIRHAQAAGLSLAEIRTILAIRDVGDAPCQHVTDLITKHLRQVDQRLVELRHTRRVLQQLSHRAAATDPIDCSQTDICTILTRT